MVRLFNHKTQEYSQVDDATPVRIWGRYLSAREWRDQYRGRAAYVGDDLCSLAPVPKDNS